MNVRSLPILVILSAIFVLPLSSSSSSAASILKKIFVPPVKQSYKWWGAEKEISLNPHLIKALVWNIYKGEKENFSQVFFDLARKRDLIFLQEMKTAPKVLRALEGVGARNWNFGLSFIYSKSGEETGVITGSRGFTREAKIFKTSDFEPILKTPKTMIVTYHKFENQSTKLMAINIHGINFTSLKPLKRQLNSVRELISIHRGPIFFAGDFNTWNQGRKEFLLSYMAQLGLSEVTFSNDRRLRVFGHALDYVFVRGLVALDAQVGAIDEGSDHAPLILELALSP